MSRYRLYATRYDDPHIIEEIRPASGLSFSFPLNDHGECTFSATNGPGGSSWRPAVAMPFTGVLVTRDGVPCWDGAIVAEQQTGPRTFSFTAREWGWWFEELVDPVPRAWVTPTNDHLIFRQLVDDAQAQTNGNLQIDTGSTLGAHSSVKTDVTAWADTKVGREFRSVGEAIGGPDWYFGIAGTIDDPRRKLYLADHHGHVTPEAVLEHVEDTVARTRPDRPPVVTLLGDLFPGPAPVMPVRRSGGNVIAVSRSRTLSESATRVISYGAGVERAQKRGVAHAFTLLSRGWPRITKSISDTTVTQQSTLTEKAVAELTKRAGIATAYSLVTLDGDKSADWTQIPRGSNVQVRLDTDVYGADRPVGGPDGFTARCLNTVVRVPDSGEAQVEWQVADVLEVF